MRQQSQVIGLVEETGIVAIIRRSTPFDAADIARALAEGGVRVLEITLNSHHALQAIESVRRLDLPGLSVGAGTVRTAEDARAALHAGAEFLVAPNFDAAAVNVAHSSGVPMLPGVATPTEAVAARQAGCELLKFFPAAALGAGYLKLIRDPLDDVKFMATGGVDRDNRAQFFQAGAIAVGLGSSLVGKGDTPPADIAERARAVINAIASVRNG
jgi:2-dehydro-3-deoxyphosphogluconate aldolase/(4S)-4-hydroxy-2-oxoglutarate aldolase